MDDQNRPGSPARPRDAQSPPTIRQVAALAGVSTATVSRVLARSGRVSPDLEERVRGAAHQLNYQPNRAARNLRARQGSTVGVLIPDIQNLFFTAIVRGIDDEVTKFGYTLLLANSDGSADRERVYLDTFRAEGVAGLLAIPSQNDERGFRQFLETGVPLVILDRTVHLPNVDIVTVTNREGAAQAVQHLVGAGPPAHRDDGRDSRATTSAASAARVSLPAIEAAGLRVRTRR